MQQRAIQALAENKDAVVGAARRGPAAFVPGGRADEIKFAQPALRRLAENFVDQQLSRTVTAKSLVISGLGQKIPATQIEAKMSGDGLAIQFQKIQREIAIARGGLRHRVIKPARRRMALD